MSAPTFLTDLKLEDMSIDLAGRSSFRQEDEDCLTTERTPQMAP